MWGAGLVALLVEVLRWTPVPLLSPAGALDRYGPALGLPPVHSGHNALHEEGGPSAGTTFCHACREVLG